MEKRVDMSATIFTLSSTQTFIMGTIYLVYREIIAGRNPAGRFRKSTSVAASNYLNELDSDDILQLSRGYMPI